MLRPMLDGVRNRHSVAVAETAFQDKWQHAEVGIVAISSSATLVAQIVDDAERFVWSFPECRSHRRSSIDGWRIEWRSNRGYERTGQSQRVCSREIIAEQLTKEDEDGLELVTITAVDVDREFEKARVYYTTVDGEDESPDVVAALERFRTKARRGGGPAGDASARRPISSSYPDDRAAQRRANRDDSQATAHRRQ